ncbi:Tm-1-like ATP-binding domain-containing protein [Taklimakanibacter lacteus]|uniref:Tm-1-like ATP-binding domain-containing protein n=1 Tax=Taklimakanibacter lacteus TaxID=2268456 RepID=UPI0034D77EE1
MKRAYVAGTFDTKARELAYIGDCLKAEGLAVTLVDLSTSGESMAGADISAQTVATFHPLAASAVFTGERGSAVARMAEAFAIFLKSRDDLGGVISAGGSGATALATPAMRALPVGVPKVMVSTIASGDVRPHVGSSDIAMIYPVTDISGLNRISRRVLANAAGALAGMMRAEPPAGGQEKPAIGLTMFGVTTQCVQMATKLLDEQYDCLVFHATGSGGQSFEALAGSGFFSGVLDITTTEIADEIAGGVLSAGPHRLDVFAEHAVPYVGSAGALDMANFWGMDTVPAPLRQRQLHVHNANVTLMRTTPEENARIGRFIAQKLNRMKGQVRFLLPMKGVSALDQEGKPFFDPAADAALFAAIENDFQTSQSHQLRKLPFHINDAQFAEALVTAFREITENP